MYNINRKWIIREEIKNGKSKYQTAAEFGIHSTVVYRRAQDLPGGQYGWPGIRGKTLEILQDLIQYGYVLGSHFNAGDKYRILKKYFPNICKISLYNKTILYLDDKKHLLPLEHSYVIWIGRLLVSRSLNRWQRLLELSFLVRKNTESSVNLGNISFLLSVGKMVVFFLVIINLSLRVDDFIVENGFFGNFSSKKSYKNRVSKDDVLLTNDDSLAFFYIRRYCNSLFSTKMKYKIFQITI